MIGARQAKMLLHLNTLKGCWVGRRSLEEVAGCPTTSSAAWALRALVRDRWLETKTEGKQKTSAKLYRLRRDLSAAKREKLEQLERGS